MAVLCELVNGGSLEKHLLEKYAEPCPEALVESALDHALHLQDLDFHEFKFAKASDVFLAVAAISSWQTRLTARFISALPKQAASVPEP